MIFSTIVLAIHGTFFSFKFTLTVTPFTLWGMTLAIFLGFRNTVAYQRFWEARILWGELLVVSRNLTRQSLSLASKLEPHRRRALANHLLGFIYLLKAQLRGAPLCNHTVSLLGESGCSALLGRVNAASAVLGRLGKDYVQAFRDSGTSEYLLINVDQQLSRLSDAMGGCERIKTTPIPYPYILMLHRTVHVYCFLLPFCLVDTLGWFTPLAVCILAYTLFGLDALGEQIADPFDTQPNDLPLDAMCRNIEIAVLELLDEPSPTPLKPVNEILL